MNWFVNVTCIMLWIAWITSIAYLVLTKRREHRLRRQLEFEQWQGTFEPLSLPRYDDLKAYSRENRNGRRAGL